MRSNTVQLAWPFALLGVVGGAQLPAGFSAAVLFGSVLGLLGALVSAALDRVRDWQVAMMAPAIGAIAGVALGFGNDGCDGAGVGFSAGVGFGLLAMPALVLITRRARRAQRLPPASLLGRAYRRRVWLMTLTASTLASLMVPAAANPWAQPADAPLAQLCALATMLLVVGDATLWLTLAQPDAPPRPPAALADGHPYRQPSPPPPPAPDLRALAALAAASLLYDALLVALVAAALLVSR
jgi:hypothetical protein